jgi:hypothetical protein
MARLFGSLVAFYEGNAEIKDDQVRKVASLLRLALITCPRVAQGGLRSDDLILLLEKERKRMSRIPIPTLLLIGIGSVCMFAQTPANSSGEQGPDSVAQQSSSHIEEAMQGGNSQELFTGLLNGSGLISMDSNNSLIFSAAVGGGWNSNPGNSSDSVSSSMYSFSPYIGLYKVLAKSKFIVQYQPTFLGYPSGTYDGQTMHAASVQADGGLSDRVRWKMNVSGSYGQNGVRFAAPLQSVAVGEVPGTTSNTASYLPGSGPTTYIFGSFETDYTKSERGTVAFDLSNSFNRVAGFDQAGSAATGRLRYRYDLSPTLSLMIYGQGTYFYGDLNCEGIGAGAGIDWQLGMNTLLTFEAGPQINSAACGDQQGYSYAVGYSTRLSSRAQFYLTTNRLPMVSYLGPGAWQNGASAGMQYQVTRTALLRADVGYSSSTALAAVSSYRGISINASYDVHLNHGLVLSYDYRGYFTDSVGKGYNGNLAQVSLKWTSNSGKIFQSQ